MTDLPELVSAGYAGDMGELLARRGRVFSAWLTQDSDCRSWAVEVGGRRWFVKHSDTPRGVASLRRAVAINRAVQHPLLPAPRQVVETADDGLALIYDWVPGESLYHGSGAPQTAGLPSPIERFRALPPARIVAALKALYDLHVQIAAAGFVAVDLYDGCLLYDFQDHQLYLCDLDEYRPGPFLVDAERLPGSRRYMAPEEFQRGATIDQRTTVFNLGRVAQQLLGGGSLAPEAWQAYETLRGIVVRATQAAPQDRYVSVDAFVSAWDLATREPH